VKSGASAPMQVINPHYIKNSI